MTVKPKREKGAFLRQCVGCGKRAHKSEFIRIAGTSDGMVSIDVNSSQGGRGAYLCRDEACLKKAIKNGRLSKTLRMPVPDSIYENLKITADKNVDD